MMKIGLIGYGYWGPNLARNFNQNSDLDLSYICDFSADRLKTASALYKQTKFVNDPEVLFKDTTLDAIAVATPVSTHFELAKRALESGKDVWLEKPMTEKVEQAEELIELAEKNKRVLHVDHTFVYTGAVRKIKELIDKGELGDLIYYDSTRVNLGLFQQDVDVIWDLAPHDISIMDYLIGERPQAVVATGSGHFDRGLEDIAYLTFYYPRNIIAHINVNWLSPVKVRTTLIGGQKMMLVWNDLEPDEKIKIYDKGVQVRTKEGKYNLLVNYRSGDMWSPKIEQTEALKVMAEAFVGYIENGGTVVNDGIAGLNVVKMLTASNQSLSNKNQTVYL